MDHHGVDAGSAALSLDRAPASERPRALGWWRSLRCRPTERGVVRATLPLQRRSADDYISSIAGHLRSFLQRADARRGEDRVSIADPPRLGHARDQHGSAVPESQLPGGRRSADSTGANEWEPRASWLLHALHPRWQRRALSGAHHQAAVSQRGFVKKLIAMAAWLA